MKIVTGYTGKSHITSADDQGRNMATFGTGSYVLSVGSEFACTMVSTNKAQIADGEGVLQGVHFRIESAEVDQLDIDSGTTGTYRKDLICAEYTKSDENIEAVSLVVIKGTESSSSDPAEPSYTTGTIRDGAVKVDFPLWELDFEGVNVTAKKLFDASISGRFPIGYIYISADSTSPAKLFGGTWTQIKDKFLLSAGDTYTAGSTGGSATNTHSHYVGLSYDTNNALYITAVGNLPKTRIRPDTTFGSISATSITLHEPQTSVQREDSTYDETISIMPPYLAVYVWQRVA